MIVVISQNCMKNRVKNEEQETRNVQNDQKSFSTSRRLIISCFQTTAVQYSKCTWYVRGTCTSTYYRTTSLNGLNVPFVRIIYQVRTYQYVTARTQGLLCVQVLYSSSIPGILYEYSLVHTALVRVYLVYTILLVVVLLVVLRAHHAGRYIFLTASSNNVRVQSTSSRIRTSLTLPLRGFVSVLVPVCAFLTDRRGHIILIRHHPYVS